MKNGLAPHPCVADKKQEGYLGNKGSQPHIRPPGSGFQCWENKSPWLLAVKTSGDGVSGRNCWIPRQFLLKGPHTDLLRLTPAELQRQGSSLKVTTGIW